MQYDSWLDYLLKQLLTTESLDVLSIKNKTILTAPIASDNLGILSLRQHHVK